MFRKILLSCALIVLYGCSSSSPHYEIGVDPTWTPLDFKERQQNVLGFCTDLFMETAKEENLLVSLCQASWDNLFENLQKGKYQAVLSSLYPYSFQESIYSFSDPFLEIGPVFIAPIDAKKHLSMEDFSGKSVGVLIGSPEILLLEKDPSIYIRTYATIPDALNDLVSGKTQGALLPVLNTSAYVNHLYFKKLKIVSKPLTDAGLRMVTLKGKNPKLIKDFNHCLQKMKKKGSYDALLSKWSLSEG